MCHGPKRKDGNPVKLKATNIQKIATVSICLAVASGCNNEPEPTENQHEQILDLSRENSDLESRLVNVESKLASATRQLSKANTRIEALENQSASYGPKTGYTSNTSRGTTSTQSQPEVTRRLDDIERAQNEAAEAARRAECEEENKRLREEAKGQILGPMDVGILCF